MTTATQAEKLTNMATQVIHSAAQDYYVFIIVFLLASALIVPLAQRFKVSSVLGFLLVGVLMGPDALGRLSHFLPGLDAFSMIRTHAVHRFAELGVVFLLFSIGLELTFERLKSMRRLVFGLGALQLVLSTAVLAVVFFMMGRSLVGAILLGMALALSSTAVVIPVLADRKALATASGRSVFAVLLAQDLSVAPIMVTVVILTGASDNGQVGVQGLLALIPALIGMGLLVGGGRWLLRPLFKSVARTKSRELFMAACLLVILLAGQVAVMTGLPMGLGAFVAGVLLAETEYRREIEVMIDPFKGLLLGLFFVTVGARLDFGAVMARPELVLGLAAGLIVLKALVVFPLAKLFGLTTRSAIETAAVLGPAGEFAYVIIDEAIGRHVIPASFGQAIILSATLSLFCVPVLAGLASRLTARMAGPREAAPSEAPDVVSADARVLVIGFGRVGELVTDMLRAHDIPFTVIDFNPKVTRRARMRGVEAWYGNAAMPEFLMRVGLERARAVVVTVSNAAFTEDVVRTVRGLRDDVHIIARARDAGHAYQLYRLGATDAVPETIEASLQLAENTLIDLGVPMGLVLASVHEQRDVFRRQFGVRGGQAASLHGHPLKGEA
ncbi:cation:proton antiporter [Asticcacaulis sp. EMRT-3]|uniref:cation:proton antiporter domain-containing protein n=1 Tax=Asticcacaulis sp. EMRT-3 TaxID=3040349 RepID=UPI0024AFBB87|nr:cation:proton antiporter [Asticcacaulis sp. EMRT-3]MDI7775312.1 cation:proton antiporter [Asticcacaulis sp. EMRT-3]